MTPDHWFWTAWIVVGLVREIAAIVDHLRRGDTLSEYFRSLFHVKEQLGRSIWMVVWAGFSVWFLVHIAFPGVVG